MPPVSSPSEVIVTPLGGLGEVGMNLMTYRYEDALIVVDCGVLFPDADMPGMDLIFPDLTHLVAQREQLRAIFLTHGHEDHIGALPFLLREFDVPVYGTRMTLALVRQKLAEYGMDSTAKLRTVQTGELVPEGPFSVEFIPVTHSIIEASSLAITTPAGVLIHTGDFKVDPRPVDGRTCDVDRFRHYGDAGVLALLSDSTNSENEGHTASESNVGETLEILFPKIPGRIFLATFSSNIHRIQQVLNAAHACGKRVAICGRSMEQNTRISRELGYLDIPPDTLIPVDSVADRPNTPVVIVTTGTQGEPMSALSRMALGEHRHLSIQAGDTVMLSSRTIPGNEIAIGRVLNRLYRIGADVVHARLSEIHVSGHAARDEQLKMLEWTRPHYFIPVHGEWRHLIHHARTAQSFGVPEARTLVIENGEPLGLSPTASRRLDSVPSGRTFVDGNAVHDIGQVILRDRRNLSAGGILVVVTGIHGATGETVLGPELLNRGFLSNEQFAEVETALKNVVDAAIASLDADALRDANVVRVRIRNRLRKHIERTLGRRPIVMPMVMEM